MQIVESNRTSKRETVASTNSDFRKDWRIVESSPNVRSATKLPTLVFSAEPSSRRLTLPLPENFNATRRQTSLESPKIMPSKCFVAMLKVMDLQHMLYDVLLEQDTQRAINLHAKRHRRIFYETVPSICPHNYYIPKRIRMFKTAYLSKVRSCKQTALTSSITPNGMGEKQAITATSTKNKRATGPFQLS